MILIRIMLEISGSNLTDLGNNYGRLNCTTFELVDTLPVAPAGREDGGAANISIKVGDKVLEEGADKDYELVLNENGTVKAIKIYYISTYESNPDDTNYVPDGAAMLTTYTINANYSKDAYRVLPNEKDDILSKIYFTILINNFAIANCVTINISRSILTRFISIQSKRYT